MSLFTFRSRTSAVFLLAAASLRAAAPEVAVSGPEAASVKVMLVKD